MITREEMFEPLLRELPDFQGEWDLFRREWSDEEGGLPLYAALSTLARHLVDLLSHGRVDPLKSAFAVVERWHSEGDAYVREAATVGLLEDLQSSDLHEGTDSED